jgi:hypothetical protein
VETLFKKIIEACIKETVEISSTKSKYLKYREKYLELKSIGFIK